MRTPLMVANWKMNTTLSEAKELVGSMLAELDQLQDVETVLCPPFVSLAAVGEMLRGTCLRLGAQNMYHRERGSYTGEVSPLMLAPLCQYVILGHGERRQYFGETDEEVNQKVGAALSAGIRPILCVGERLEEREAGWTEEVVVRQVRGALLAIPNPGGLVIAYEPIWAIGGPWAASGRQAAQAIGLIRQEMAELYDGDTARGLRIQYGGSVTAQNVAEFLREPEIDGALVGGSSLRAQEFVSIVAQAARIKGGEGR